MPKGTQRCPAPWACANGGPGSLPLRPDARRKPLEGPTFLSRQGTSGPASNEVRERLQRPHAHLFAAGRRVTACKLVRGPTEAKGSLGNLIVMRGVWLPFEYSARLVSNFLSLRVSFPLINLCIPMFFLPLCSELGVLTTPPWFSLLLQTSPAAQLRLLKAGDTLLPPPSAEPPALREGGREGELREGAMGRESSQALSSLPSWPRKHPPTILYNKQPPALC